MFLRLGGRQALSHLSDRSCFPVTRIPLEPAHHPSASRDEAFSSQQLLPFLLFLINFLQRFALAQELSADGPKRASRGGGWERAKDGPGGAAPGLRKPCRRSVMPQVLWVKQETPRLPDCQDQQDCRESKHAGNFPAHTERMHLHAHTCA